MRRNWDISMIIIVVILAFSSLRRGAFTSPMEWLMQELMLLPAIIIGLSFHEYAHAVVAYKLGDPTPKMQGRVSLNPMAHIDWIGFAALIFVGFGWGRPVEINPSNFRNRRKGELMVALAGVAMNLLIAVVFAVIAKIVLLCGGYDFVSTNLGTILWKMIINVIWINLVLMLFNLIPCPPLDGFSVVTELFNIKHTQLYWRIYQYGNLILIALIVFNVTYIILNPCVDFFFSLLMNYLIM